MFRLIVKFDMNSTLFSISISLLFQFLFLFLILFLNTSALPLPTVSGLNKSFCSR